MYALEERKKAVELYLKYGRHAALVMRELRYPDYKSLIAWVKEYEETGTLHEWIWRPKRDRCALTSGQLGGDWRTAKIEM